MFHLIRNKHTSLISDLVYLPESANGILVCTNHFRLRFVCKLACDQGLALYLLDPKGKRCLDNKIWIDDLTQGHSDGNEIRRCLKPEINFDRPKKMRLKKRESYVYYCVTSKITIDERLSGFIGYNVLLRFNKCADLRNLETGAYKTLQNSRRRRDIFSKSVSGVSADLEEQLGATNSISSKKGLRSFCTKICKI